jgi:segregation and condensation protein A
MTPEPLRRSLSDFTVELDVYSGPYEWLLALILKDELEIFEVPLREVVASYLLARQADATGGLERDTDFAGSAAALVLLKSRTLSPAIDADTEGIEDETLSPEELAEKLTEYLRIRRAADHLRDHLVSNAGHYASGHTIPPRPGSLSIDPERVSLAARQAFSRVLEPPVRHLGPITVTLQELAGIIRTALAGGPISYESLTSDMDRMNRAVAFAAALSLAQEGNLTLAQAEPLGPLILEPSR